MMKSKSEKLSKLQAKQLADKAADIILHFEDSVGNDLAIQCPVTGKDIFNVVDGKKHSIESHGKCYDCGHYFHIEALRTGEGMSRSSWPICYKGYSCKECYSKPGE